jgi:rhodanese-related sulfurtransferase
MKKFINYFMLALIIPAFIITACKDKTDPAPAEKGNFETLANYMTANGMDLPALLDGWVIAPEMKADGGIVEADYSIPDYNVFDIRSEADFNAGHIKGAINVPLKDIVAKAKELGTDKPYLVVCKTGQTAGRGTMALRLSGFSAKVMKFGMSYWNAQFDAWTPNIGDNALDSPNWVSDASATMPVNDFPAWETTSTDGAEILAANVDAMLAAEGWGVGSDGILADPAAYKIYNFWTSDDYTAFGHFSGAYQFKPISLENDLVAALPNSDDCYIYCFTGQTSSYITAWLQVLGYNAKSILFGVNKLQHTALDAASKPVWHHSYDYEFVTEN